MLIIALSAFVNPSLAEAQDVKIIVNENLKISYVSKDDLKKIALGKGGKWADGTPTLFVLNQNPEVKQTFLEQFVDLSPSAFLRHWRRLSFSGRASSPKKFDNSQELADYVGSRPGAVSFIAENDAVYLNGVKSIKVID